MDEIIEIGTVEMSTVQVHTTRVYIVRGVSVDGRGGVKEGVDVERTGSCHVRKEDQREDQEDKEELHRGSFVEQLGT